MLAAALIVAMASCTNPQPSAPPPPPAQPAPAAGPRILFPDGSAVRVELAADDETRAQGLMYRDRLAPGTGMIFLFPESGDYPFWMKNTLIPLDMIWIDEGKSVVAIHEDVPPCKADPCPSYPPNARAKYVLELAAGGAKEHHLAVGSKLRFEGMENVVVR